MAQVWCPDLSNQERNQGAKVRSCIAMEVEILEIYVSMQKSSRMEILSSDSDSLHRKALDCNIQFRNSFKIWKIEFFRKFGNRGKKIRIPQMESRSSKKRTIPKALPHHFPHHATWNAHRIPNGAKHSPRSAIYMKCVRPRWPMKISTKIIALT